MSIFVNCILVLAGVAIAVATHVNHSFKWPYHVKINKINNDHDLTSNVKIYKFKKVDNESQQNEITNQKTMATTATFTPLIKFLLHKTPKNTPLNIKSSQPPSIIVSMNKNSTQSTPGDFSYVPKNGSGEMLARNIGEQTAAEILASIPNEAPQQMNIFRMQRDSVVFVGPIPFKRCRRRRDLPIGKPLETSSSKYIISLSNVYGPRLIRNLPKETKKTPRQKVRLICRPFASDNVNPRLMAQLSKIRLSFEPNNNTTAYDNKTSDENSGEVPGSTKNAASGAGQPAEPEYLSRVTPPINSKSRNGRGGKNVDFHAINNPNYTAQLSYRYHDYNMQYPAFYEPINYPVPNDTVQLNSDVRTNGQSAKEEANKVNVWGYFNHFIFPNKGHEVVQGLPPEFQQNMIDFDPTGVNQKRLAADDEVEISNNSAAAVATANQTAMEPPPSSAFESLYPEPIPTQEHNNCPHFKTQPQPSIPYEDIPPDDGQRLRDDTLMAMYPKEYLPYWPPPYYVEPQDANDAHVNQIN